MVIFVLVANFTFRFSLTAVIFVVPPFFWLPNLNTSVEFNHRDSPPFALIFGCPNGLSGNSTQGWFTTTSVFVYLESCLLDFPILFF